MKLTFSSSNLIKSKFKNELTGIPFGLIAKNKNLPLNQLK
jgi:hypothetical protein